VIRIRPGRSWRHNPAYALELSGGGARNFDGEQILDVLGIEVDGVDIAAGVGEGRVLLAMEELLRALFNLGEGASAAQATIGPGPTELVLEARGEDLLLTLVSLSPPSRVLAAGLLVDAQKMQKAVLQAARGLLLDLLAIAAELGSAQISQRLSSASAQLARQRKKEARKWPRREISARTIVCKAQPFGEAVSLQLPPETMSRLLGRGDVPHAALAAHLGAGSVAFSRKGAPGLAAEGPLFLLLRNLLEQSEKLVEFQESGETEYTLRFGPHELRWDLRAGEVRAAGWRAPARLPAIRFARLVAQSAVAYGRISKAADDLSADLVERGTRLRDHCRDLQSGDLRRSNAHPPTAKPPPALGPLAQRMRRLLYREAFRVEVGEAQRVVPAPDALLVEGREEIFALDPTTGERVWTSPAAPGFAVRGTDVFFCEPSDALVRADAATGEVRFRRRLRGGAHPAKLWPLSRGVLRGLPGEGVALVDEAGVLRFRTKLPGGEPLCAVEARDALVLGQKGFCVGLDAAFGAVLWKRRASVRELVACGQNVLLLESASLVCLAPGTGKVHVRTAVPSQSHGLRIHGDAAVLLTPSGMLSLSLQTLAVRKEHELPWARHLCAENEPDSLIVTGEGGAAVSLQGKKWSVEPDGSRGAPAQQRRGVVLLSRKANELYALDSGLPLASLPAGEAVLCDDLSCLIQSGSALSSHRLVTHLALL
jgi:outer membrane protein assembly factor BamB